MAPGSIEFSTLEVLFEDHDDITYDVSTVEGRKKTATQPYTLKESCHYKIKIEFIVKEDIISGLRCQTTHFRKGIRVSKDNAMLGSFGPQKATHCITLPRHGWDEAPDGQLARGSYTSKIIFADDDRNVLGELETAFDIKSDW